MTLSYRQVTKLLAGRKFSDATLVEQLAKEGLYRYIDPKRQSEDDVLLWSVSALTRRGKILSYRAGRYRDDRDHFAHKRSIAFCTLVSETDRTLFDRGYLGVLESALFAVAADLDIPMIEAVTSGESFEYSLNFLALQPEVTEHPSIAAFVEVQAPDWFEPTASKLSINELCWLDMSAPPNNWDDFDPWSRTILSYYFPEVAMHG